MAHVLIVHAHHEPQSFSTSLAKAAAEVLSAQGHQVDFSDLYAQKFDPVSDRRNFTTVSNAHFLKQQIEETFATENHGFSPELEAEMLKLQKCDLLVFSFPLWWFGLPAILKGWVDRVFAYERFYGSGKWYDNGFGRGRRALVLATTGSEAAFYAGNGPHPAMEIILTPIHHGVFGFNGFSTLHPFIAWSAAHISDEERRAVLGNWRDRLVNVFDEKPLRLASMKQD